MPNRETAQRGERTGLSSSRAEFAASLRRRLESVLGALSALEQQPASTGRRDNFLRRVHALGASAKVLGFASAAEDLTCAEQQIRTSQVDTLADDILVVQKHLAALPTLVLRGAYSLSPPSSPPAQPKSAPQLISEPLAVVIWGTPDFVETLKSLDESANALEVTSITDPEKLRETCIALGPDVLLLDANKGSITLLVVELAQSPEIADVAIVVANVPDDAASGLLELGVRLVLPSRATAQQLSRALLQVRHVPVERAPTPIPLGALTLKDLAERLAQEIRQGLVDSAAPSAHLERIGFGDGTPIRAALWSALAQIREQVTEISDGRIQFVSGPDGGVPLAPRSMNSARGSGQTNSVDLSGRRILVVDDDPAVAWFVGGTLRAAGAVVTEVHDGSQALELAYRTWPELIVSDVMMPGLDGFALCHAVKRDVLLRDVPIVLLSWKEDLLFRLRDLGADADGYLRKEANASTVVRRVRELLLPRSALERRLLANRETRGRLDGTTTRQLLELAAALERPVRIALRDASALYDIRLRHGSLAAATRTRYDGTVEHGGPVLGAMLGITAGRFSVVTDYEPCEAIFSGSLSDILRPSVLRARAAQRLLSGLTLGLIDRLTMEPDAFGSDLPMLPKSLRPIADQLLRGIPPRQLLASGVVSLQLLESLLSDVARRGAVRSIADAQGEDLLEREILSLSATPSIAPPKPLPAPPPLFTFQLSPAAPEARESHATTRPTPTPVPATLNAVEWHGKPSGSDVPDARAGAGSVAWDFPSGTLSGVGHSAGPVGALQRQPGATFPKKSATTVASVEAGHAPAQDAAPGQVASKPLPTDDGVDWAMELNWDSTPPPVDQESTGSVVDAASRPGTSGGFMRPAIAALERCPPQVTPDLANAVVQAVSEATPSPVISTAATLTNTEASDSEGHSDKLPMETAARKIAATALSKPEASVVVKSGAKAAEALTPSNATYTTAVIVTAGAMPPPPAATPSPASLSIGQTKAPSPTPSADAPAPRPPERPPGVDRNAAPATAVDKPATAAAATQPHVGTGQEVTIDRPVFAESPMTLPVVRQPPRPEADSAVVEAHHHLGSIEWDSEDPVFPLVSAANIAVDVQRSIVVAVADNCVVVEQSLPVDFKSVDPGAARNRDTLRSPGDSIPEGSESRRESAMAIFSRSCALSDQAPANSATSEPFSRPTSPETTSHAASSTIGTSRAPSLPPSALPHATSAQHARPVGWIQALGLAALAGIVTFAVTVPVTSWIRKRQEAVTTEPPVALETLPSVLSGSENAGSNKNTSEGPHGSSNQVPGPGTAAQASSDSPTAASAQPSATALVEEIPVPADVPLPTGQALIEVMTGGGHAIFVDDSFVGRGPVRVITVQPGRHIVRTRLNGVERSDPVEVGAGRSLRLSLEHTWK